MVAENEAKQFWGIKPESQLGSFPAACGELYFAMNVSLRSKHQAPKREAFGCRDAPPRFIRGRRSRGLAPGWQTKGADIHCLVHLLGI